MIETEVTEVTEIESGQNNPYVKVIMILNNAFDYFNDLYCGNFLKRPLITLMSRERRPCFGWHWKDKWTYGDLLHAEIMIAAETLKRSIYDVLETLLHEMVHLYNSQRDIKDCNSSQYHNKNFKKCAKEVFHLEVDKMPQRGFALTRLTVKSRNDVQAFITKENITDFYLTRNSEQGSAKLVKKQYNINISEEDYRWFKQLREALGDSSKELFATLRDTYTLNEENSRVELAS